LDIAQVVAEHRLYITTEGLACSCRAWWLPGDTDPRGAGYHSFQHHLLDIAMPVRFEIRRPVSDTDPGISGRWG
jgi:hypothetical protein